MADINIIKTNKILDLNNLKPTSFREFSVSIVPGTVSAVGFDLKAPWDEFSMIDWFMILKFVNASKEDLIIEDINAEWIGKNSHRCKSIHVSIYKADSNDEEAIINQLLEIEKITSKKQSLFFPILLKEHSEKILRIDFLLKTYKRIFFNYWLPISFKRKEIKASKTYEQLLQKAIIKIKINKSSKPLLLKI